MVEQPLHPRQYPQEGAPGALAGRSDGAVDVDAVGEAPGVSRTRARAAQVDACGRDPRTGGTTNPARPDMKPAALDKVLLAHTPVETVPLHGTFEPLTRVGHRFLAANDGLWLEAQRGWVHVLWPLATLPVHGRVKMPLGSLSKRVTLALPLAVASRAAQRFMIDARALHPREVGAVMIWNCRDGACRYQ